MYLRTSASRYSHSSHTYCVRRSWTATALRSCTCLCTSASRYLHSSHTHCTLELDCYCSPLLHILMYISFSLLTLLTYTLYVGVGLLLLSALAHVLTYISFALLLLLTCLLYVGVGPLLLSALAHVLMHISFALLLLLTCLLCVGVGPLLLPALAHVLILCTSAPRSYSYSSHTYCV
jgi:hypothetical protein